MYLLGGQHTVTRSFIQRRGGPSSVDSARKRTTAKWEVDVFGTEKEESKFAANKSMLMTAHTKHKYTYNSRP